MSNNSDKSKAKLVTVDEGSEGQRLDNFLVKQLKGVPKSRVYRIIRKGEVRVNKGRAQASQKLEIGDEVRIPPIRVSENEKKVSPSTYWGNVIAAATIRETPEYLFINKPSGLAVHGGSGQSAGLIEQLRLSRPNERALELVHRLDKDTSGVIVVAKKRSSLRRLQMAWQEGQVDKTYTALVQGEYDGPSEIRLPLRKLVTQQGDRKTIVDHEDGKDSITEVKVVERLKGATLIEAKLITGRMHQIRCHLAAVGYPIVADDKYGNFKRNGEFSKKYQISQLCLHASELAWPNAEWEVRAPLPAHFVKGLNQLRKLSNLD
ncbi:MAG: hypothetical protein CMF48_06575 [Legionellales bacterium]|nr:hypothetical protein [Legionellales bacterium]